MPYTPRMPRMAGRLSQMYGTFPRDCLRGRMLELDTCIRSKELLASKSVMYVLLAWLFWPVSWLFSVVISLVGSATPGLVMGSLWALVASLVGYFVFLFPCVCIMLSGGIHAVSALIAKGEASWLDVMTFLFGHLMVMLFLNFAWTFFEITDEVVHFKSELDKVWKRKKAEAAIELMIPDEQRLYIERFMETRDASGPVQVRIDVEGSMTARSNMSSDGAVSPGGPGGCAKFYLLDMLLVLETLPGWSSDAEDSDVFHHTSPRPKVEATNAEEDDPTASVAREPGNAASLLKRQKTHQSISAMFEGGFHAVMRAKEGYHPGLPLGMLDVYASSVGAKWSTMHADIRGSLRSACERGLFGLRFLQDQSSENPVRICILTALAALRAFLPRIWVKFVLGGPWLPLETPAMAALVIWALVFTFVTGAVWYTVFFSMLKSYKGNRAQLMLLSALVDPTARTKYTEQVLVKACRSQAECQETLLRLPLLDLRQEQNVMAFWHIREYTMLDRTNERHGMKIALQMMLVWLLSGFVLACLDLFSEGFSTGLVIPVMLDMLVLGMIVADALLNAMEINSIYDSHENALVEARHDLLFGAKLGGKSREDKAEDEFEKEVKMAEVEGLIKLMDHLMQKVGEPQTRERLLFGYDVTLGTMTGILGGILGMLWTIVEACMTMGLFKDQLAEHGVSTLAHGAAHEAARFLHHVF